MNDTTINKTPFKDVLTQLKLFLNEDPLKFASLKECCADIGEEFIKRNPKTSEELDKFYDESNTYCYENSYWNSKGVCKRRFSSYIKVLNEYNIKDLLEIGIGNGSNAISFALNGFNVTVTRSRDLAFRFFEYRLKTFYPQLKIKIIDSLNDIDRISCICHFDVVEHVLDPYSFMDATLSKCDYTLFVHAFNVHTPELGGYPQHFDINVSKFFDYIKNKGFEKIRIKAFFPPIFFKKVKLKNE